MADTRTFHVEWYFIAQPNDSKLTREIWYKFRPLCGLLYEATIMCCWL